MARSRRPRRARAHPLYPTEAALCRAAAVTAVAGGWTIYPETSGFDMVLVQKDLVVGIQAKLKANLKLIYQAWDCRVAKETPDYVVILTPRLRRHERFTKICHLLGILHWAPEQNLDTVLEVAPSLARCDVKKKLWLPKYIPDVVAGAQGPVQLTQWKIKALEILALIEIRGFVTRADFKRIGLSPQRWGLSGWAQLDGKKYVAGPNKMELIGQHPQVWPQILNDQRNWLAQQVDVV